MATLKLEIVTPESKAYSDDVEMVVVPGSEGELGILPQHIPLLTAIKPGELRVQKQGQETVFAVGEGFVEVTQESVIVLTDMALKDTQIDEALAQEEVNRAEAELKSHRRGQSRKIAGETERQAPPASLTACARRGSDFQ
jgi:F-type H+-transporting ATPase subunit epsilon